ncbi:hypothetical protein [Amycolatopsis sp. PS_44_ISF1]|uniref:hypothetical protein n=1 Tax=Amycolatopsis sp. PS_44_ISF1 TaxID=2974917 RepID=UPI0028DF4AFE|nr:hypothetical protein [Amycolatopsis sp. PS_44_ISF1]MDT8914974.1 hypothetical protein [Amycolatopsis sp. PS_44_ISF1]
MSAVATREEFGLWYEEQAGTPVRRLLCAFAAELAAPAGPGRVAGALGRVVARYPECRAVFGPDEEGTLVRRPGPDLAATVLFGPEWSVAEAAAALGGEPLSAETGPLLRLGVRTGPAGAAGHVIGVAHHVVWDGRSEELFWTALARELADPGPDGPLRPPPPAAPAAEPDPQWRAVVAPGRWDAARRRARAHGVTPFSWLVGHFAAATAEAGGQAVTPYVDVDLRAFDPGARERVGYFQTQRALGVVEPGTPGPEAARAVLADIGALAVLALTTGLPPDREAAGPGTTTCKFYGREQLFAPGAALIPIDTALPVARNDLAAGLTAAGGRTHLTVTARRGAPGPDPAGLGRALLAALDRAAHGGPRGDEDA